MAAASKVLANLVYPYRAYGISLGTMICGWDKKVGNGVNQVMSCMHAHAVHMSLIFILLVAYYLSKTSSRVNINVCVAVGFTSLS